MPTETTDVKSFANTTIADHLIHGKVDNGEEVILLPITRYENVLGSPKIVDDITTFKGAPYFFYTTDEVDVEQSVLEEMLGIQLTDVSP